MKIFGAPLCALIICIFPIQSTLGDSSANDNSLFFSCAVKDENSSTEALLVVARHDVSRSKKGNDYIYYHYNGDQEQKILDNDHISHLYEHEIKKIYDYKNFEYTDEWEEIWSGRPYAFTKWEDLYVEFGLHYFSGLEKSRIDRTRMVYQYEGDKQITSRLTVKDWKDLWRCALLNKEEGAIELDKYRANIIQYEMRMETEKNEKGKKALLERKF